VNIEIRTTTTPITVSRTKLLGANESWKETVNLPGIDNTNTVALEFSRIPPLALEKRLSYLIQYPHGCIEQTTSAVFPQLFLSRALTLSPNDLSRTRENIAAGITRIASFQTYTGGFAYWPGSGEAHEWGTSYAGHFLLTAKKLGYDIPQTLITKWIDHQRNRAVLWSSGSNDSDSKLNQAYRLYTLALAGSPDLGSMNRLRESANLPPDAAWRLAAAYWTAGQRDIARSLTRNLPSFNTSYRDQSGVFGSTLRDKALVLETLSIMEDSNRAKSFIEDISARFINDEWLSTQEIAFSLVAILPYINSTGTLLNVQYTAAGQTKTAEFTSPLTREAPLAVSGTSAEITVKNNGQTPLYAHIRARGTPAEGSEPALAQGLAITHQYLVNGVPTTLSAIAQGDDIEMRVTVSNQRSSKVENIALVCPFPASWEIINTRLSDTDGNTLSASFDYQDIRDDRVMTYFNMDSRQNKTFYFRLNKTYGGTFVAPALRAYAMYDESIQAVMPVGDTGASGGR
jgi:uncharacterized protein YfaS (alpha-2-macroglobulin family)